VVMYREACMSTFTQSLLLSVVQRLKYWELSMLLQFTMIFNLKDV
jgi:hypothetical protein